MVFTKNFVAYLVLTELFMLLEFVKVSLNLKTAHRKYFDNGLGTLDKVVPFIYLIITT